MLSSVLFVRAVLSQCPHTDGCVPCGVAGHGIHFSETCPPFAIVIGDSLHGATQGLDLGHNRGVRWAVVRHLCVEYNHGVATGMLKVAPGAVAHVDYRDVVLVQAISERYSVGLPARLQGVNMCGFQSVEHIRGVLGEIHKERQQGVPWMEMWPAALVPGRCAAVHASVGGGRGQHQRHQMFGTEQSEALTYRRRICASMKRSWKQATQQPSLDQKFGGPT